MTHPARTPRRSTVVVSLLAGAGLVAGLAVAPGAQAARPDAPSPSRFSELDELVVQDGQGGGPALVAAPPGRPVERPSGLPEQASDAAVARAHLAGVAPLWGVPAGTRSLRAIRSVDLEGVGPVVRFAQLVDGVPVYGGELVVSLDERGALQSVGGATTDPGRELAFAVGAGQARAAARGAAAERLGVPANVLRVGTAFRYAYDPALLDESGPVRPVWRVVAGLERSSAKVEVLVDARDASVVAVHGEARHLQRAVCDGGSDASYLSDAAYGWCGEYDVRRYRDTNKDRRLSTADALQVLDVPYARSEGDGATGRTDVDAAFSALGATSDLFAALGYDLTESIAPATSSINARGGATRALAGIVRYCDPVEAYYAAVPPGYTNAEAYDLATYLADRSCPYANAYWFDVDWDWDPASGTPYPGGQMFIGRGLAVADDVIAHELTHGVTSAVNQLVYRNQSGAINESMSDVFGQLAQLYADPFGSDRVAWLMGEKINAPGIKGAVRSMSNPAATNLPEGNPQPARMTSPYWDRDEFGQDAGGVHGNSGVGNKAAYLITKGGTFNGVSVRRLDVTNDPATAVGARNALLKTARLYWVTQNLLPKTANYRRLALGLHQACQSLVGSSFPGAGGPGYAFTSADCSRSVLKAASATEMSRTKVVTDVGRAVRTYGQGRFTVTARVTDLRGAAAGTAKVTLQRRAATASRWTTVGTGTTVRGTRSWTVKAARSTLFRTRYTAAAPFGSRTSVARKVAVSPRVTRTVSATRISFGQSFKVRGRVAPTLAFEIVELQQKRDGKWRTVQTDWLNGRSRFALAYRPTTDADRSYRVIRPATKAYGVGTSKRFTVRVR